MSLEFLRKTEWKEGMAVLLLMGLLGALVVVEGCSAPPPAASTGAAMDFSAKNLDGKVVKLSDFRGKMVLVNFWAVWCGPCQEEIPELVDLYKNYRDKGFVILGVSDPSDLSEIKTFVAQHKMDYPIVIDPGAISDEYSVVGFPTSILIDRNGKIVKKFTGYSPDMIKRIEFQIQKMI